MTISIAVVCEADADFRIATDLADRVCCETIKWLDPELVETLRTYRGESESEPFLRWKDIPGIAKRLRIRTHGHFNSQPGNLDAAATRRALHICMASDRPPTGVILVRDSDNQPREEGMRQARDDFESKRGYNAIAMGVAHSKRECWVIAGFAPRTNDESATVRDLTRGTAGLGFDPIAHSERLTATDESAKKSPKRILNALTGGNRQREVACWKDTPLDTLRMRGQQNGLARYLTEVRDRICPLFTRPH